jgi:thiol-disulfide isomerase/thioredoxin
MKKNKNIIGLVIVCLTLLTSAVNAQTNYRDNELANLKIHKNAVKVPDIEFYDASGTKITNINLLGKVSVINLWATWCPPCVKELPSIDRLAKSVNQNNIKIYAVSQDRAGNKIVPPYFQKLNLKNLTIFLDNQGNLMTAFKTPVLPTTIIIDKKGMEIARLVGEINWDSQEVINYLNKTYNEK